MLFYISAIIATPIMKCHNVLFCHCFANVIFTRYVYKRIYNFHVSFSFSHRNLLQRGCNLLPKDSRIFLLVTSKSTCIHDTRICDVSRYYMKENAKTQKVSTTKKQICHGIRNPGLIKFASTKKVALSSSDRYEEVNHTRPSRDR